MTQDRQKAQVFENPAENQTIAEKIFNNKTTALKDVSKLAINDVIQP